MSSDLRIEDAAIAAAAKAADSVEDPARVKLELDGSVDSEAESDKMENKITIHNVPEDAPFYALPYHYTYWLYTVVAKQTLRGLYYNVHNTNNMTDDCKTMHASAEVFDPHAERVFQYLQVISACAVAFAHGSNDVANAIGPFSGIYQTYTTYNIPSSSSTTPKWIFVLGGIGIVVGLMTYG